MCGETIRRCKFGRIRRPSERLRKINKENVIVRWGILAKSFSMDPCCLIHLMFHHQGVVHFLKISNEALVSAGLQRSSGELGAELGTGT